MHRTFRLLAALLVAGCSSYGATNSPISDKNAIAAPELVGRWIDPENDICLVIEPSDRNAYRAIVNWDCSTDPQDSSTLLAGFTRLGGELFAATQRELTDTAVDVDDWDVLALYSFYRLRTGNDSLFVRPLDADSLRAYLGAHPAAIPFALLEGNGPGVLLTGTPEELATFLATHARDSTLWGGEDGELGFARVR